MAQEQTKTTQFFSIFQRLETIKKSYMEKSPYDKCRFVYDIHASLVNLVGLHVVDKNYKMNVRTLIPIYVEVNYLSLLIYTLIHYKNEPFKALIATPAAGIIIPCLIILLLALYPPTRLQLRSLYNFGADFIYTNSDTSPKTHAACDKMAIYLLTCSIRVNALVFFSYSLLIWAPFYKNFFTDDREMVIPVILPFIDENSDFGFTINTISQMITVLMGTFVIPGVELTTCVLKNNVTATAACVVNSIKEFEELVGEDKTFSNKCTFEFRNIILKILDFNRYVVGFTEVFYWKHFIQPIFLMYAISVSMFLYITQNWITGIGMSACCYLQLLILCDVGKTVADANEAIVNALNRYPFYMMPLKKQEVFALILNRMQNGAKIHMGPFRELNYETATDLTNTVYKILMFMLRSRK